jgi:phenylacetate-CoA ligase
MKSTAEIVMRYLKKEKMRRFYELTKSQWLPSSEIKKIQEKKFLRLIKHCDKNVSYYRGIDGFGKVSNLSDIVNLPFLTKEKINERREDLKASNMPEKYFMPNSTGGSTGETLNFFSDYSNYMGYGILTRNNIWTGWTIGSRQVMLWGSHYDITKAEKYFNQAKNQLIHKILYLSSYDMREVDMIKYCQLINKYKPHLITAYPSGIFVFADFLAKKGLSVIKPKGIICSGETLFEYQRETIESVFGCKVYNRYGCRETGNIAHHCEYREDLHINAEHVIVEVVDKHGNSCKADETGDIVVTDLDNYVFPFIRYRVGDKGSLSDVKCRCGRGLPSMHRIEGRAFDIVIGTNGNLISGNFWTIILRTYVKGIRQFQVVQEKKDELIIVIVADENFDLHEKDRLIAEIHRKCGNDMNVSINNVNEIPLTKSGKQRFVISRVMQVNN